NHRAHVRNFLFAEEHVLGTAEADAFGAKRTSLNGIARNVGIGADLHRAERFRPLHKFLQFGIVGIRIDGVEFAFDHAAGSAVERNPVTFFEGLALHAHFALLFVNNHFAGAGHAALAHAARHDSGMAGHAAARGENTFRDFHAVNVLGRGFGS